MMTDAYPLWLDLEQEAGTSLFRRTGIVYFGTAEHPELTEVEAALTAVGVPYENHDAETVTTRHPSLRLKPSERAIFQEEGGFLRADDVVKESVRLAREAGATIHENITVVAVTPEGNGVRVQTTTGDSAYFDRVIVTAGAWLSALFATLNLPLTVTTQQVTYVAATDFPPDAPVWIDADTYWYGFPADGRVPGVKLAMHIPGASGEEMDAAALTFAQERFAGIGTQVTESYTCLYTNTSSGDFLIDTVPDASNILLMSACSGHGFKFTVLLGKIAADWARGVPYSRDLSRFAIAKPGSSDGLR
jgi:glycine/D-amino acid oxidase-like deaminating enzyme